jgi:dihydropteroate synthase
MGILNVTPDSFSDGGHYKEVASAIDRIWLMIKQGADVIDIGGESTRPGSDPVSTEEELARVLPVLEKALEHFPDTVYSIDTTKPEVARQALELGAHLINDVSGLQKAPELAALCAEFGAGYVLMHSQGDPKTMQENPTYHDVLEDILTFMDERILTLEKEGVKSIIIDPGIGFGKTLDHNCKIISELQKFSKFDYPVLMGASRKSMIGQILDGRPKDDRLIGTICVHYHSLMNGASMLRVHDVKEAVDSIKIFNAMTSRADQ